MGRTCSTIFIYRKMFHYIYTILFFRHLHRPDLNRPRISILVRADRGVACFTTFMKFFLFRASSAALCKRIEAIHFDPHRHKDTKTLVQRPNANGPRCASWSTHGLEMHLHGHHPRPRTSPLLLRTPATPSPATRIRFFIGAKLPLWWRKSLSSSTKLSPPSNHPWLQGQGRGQADERVDAKGVSN
jgi:hypothetical protein